ncbi:putative E3 SUMO-protein ligase RNF212 [Stigmatopora nigra]
MSNWIYCNACFLPPSSQIQLALTSCGHIICSNCYYKGDQLKCLICNENCQMRRLSNKSPPEMKAMFHDINVTAKQQMLEINEVLKFQDRQSNRLLKYYRTRNEKVEECWLEMKQENQQMVKTMKEQQAYISELEHSLQSLKTSSMRYGSQSAHGIFQNQYDTPTALSRNSSLSDIHGNVVTETQPTFFQEVPQRQPVNIPGSSRIVSPHDGHMGGPIPHRRSSTTADYRAYLDPVSRRPRTPLSFGHTSARNFPF